MNKLPVIFLLPFLGACAGPKVTELDVQIAQHQAIAARACYAAQSLQLPQYADAKDAALLVMAQALAKGQSDPCRQTNVYDAKTAIARSQNRTTTGIIGNVVNGTLVGTGIIAGANVLKHAVDKAGDTVTVDGERNIYSDYQTTSNSNTRQMSGSGSNTNTLPVSGPDQSTRTTTTVTEAAK